MYLQRGAIVKITVNIISQVITNYLELNNCIFNKKKKQNIRSLPLSL